MRGFDVDHRVEGFVREGQVLGAAVHKIQPGQDVPLSAVGDTVRVEVQARVGGGLQRAGEVGGSVAVAAADLSHLFAAEVDLGRGLVVKLDGVPVGLV